MTELRVSVAQLDVSTTSKLDGIIESLENISFDFEVPENQSYSVLANFNIEDDVFFPETNVEAAGQYSPEIILAAVRNELLENGARSAIRVCEVASDGLRSCAISYNRTTEIDTTEAILNEVGAFAQDDAMMKQMLRFQFQAQRLI